MMRVLMLSLAVLFAAPASGAGPDAETRALIERLRLEPAPRPVRESPGWRVPDEIYLTIPPRERDREAALLASAREVAGPAEIVPLHLGFGEAPPERVLAEAEVLLGYCSPAVVRQAKQLRWLQHYGTGVDHCTLIPEIEDAGFILTNVQHTAGPPIAEHVIAMMMTLARRMPDYLASQWQGEWNRQAARGEVFEVSGKTMLIAGLGGIGTEVARRAHGLGMRVVATRRSSRQGPEFVDYVGLADELHELAGQADVIVNALPLTTETWGLFDQAFFRAAKRGALFISIGRGKSTVTADLLAALRSGQLAGAGLDVTDPEPLPAGHPLFAMRNVVITPHIAWQSDRGFERGWLVVRENLRRYVNGEPLLNVVDLDRGY